MAASTIEYSLMAVIGNRGLSPNTRSPNTRAQYSCPPILLSPNTATGTVLVIANPGAKVGAYGTLNLAADGAYSYSLTNARSANDDAWRMSA